MVILQRLEQHNRGYLKDCGNAPDSQRHCHFPFALFLLMWVIFVDNRRLYGCYVTT